ncbi:MAG: thiamine diphosphokinase [Clostridia bacterium]|nr:thiamine diphosphokinase [Clostridia bacterium]
MKRCVIVGGAPISEYDRIAGMLRPDDYVIYCDCGLAHMDKLDAKPDLIIGDFDSHPVPDTDVETITLPVAKDDTYTVFAASEALRRGFEEFLIVGAVGGRFDHSLANASLLLMLHRAGAKAVLADDFSDMEILGSRPLKISEKYKYFSLTCIFGAVSGVNIQGARFPLTDGRIEPDYQYAVSNEVLPGQTATVSVKNGEVLLIKDYR